MAIKRYDIRISGRGNLESFLTKLKSSGAKITLLIVKDRVAYFRTDKKGLKEVRRFRRQFGLKVKITVSGENSGIALLSPYRYAVFFIVPLVCSFFLWSVTVDSDVPEVADRIEQKLVNAEIVRFRPLIFIPMEDEIRRYLMQDDPSLSWVRFKRVGTSLTVIPMLSPASDVKMDQEGPPSDLIARTGGVLTRFALTKGERIGHVYMTVKKGDVLATGILEQGDKTVIVGAEGAVYADFWVEYSFSIPKIINYKVQGEENIEFVFNPPWKIKKESDVPFWHIFTTKRFTTINNSTLELEKGMEESVIVPLIKNQLLAEHGPDAVIKDDKVLHVTFDNDKVNGKILFHINDNIAVKRPISQGD